MPSLATVRVPKGNAVGRFIEDADALPSVATSIQIEDWHLTDYTRSFSLSETTATTANWFNATTGTRLAQTYSDYDTQLRYYQTSAISLAESFIGMPVNSGTASYIEDATRKFNEAIQLYSGTSYGNYGTVTIGYDSGGTDISVQQAFGTVSIQYRDPKEDARNQFKNKIQNNLLIKSGKRFGLEQIIDPAEIKARLTLRDLLSEADWRRYVSNGFIMHKGASRWYQIFNNQRKRVAVYENGQNIAEVCVHSDALCPPTDHVINMITLIQFDEEAFYRFGNVTWFTDKYKNRNNNGLDMRGNIQVNGNSHLILGA